MKKLQLALLAALLTGLAAVPSARANVIITSPATASEHSGNIANDYTIGYAFTVGSNNLTVTSLGIWDKGSDGLGESHDIGLWTTGGSLLRSVTVPSGTTGTLIGQFRYSALSSNVTLTHGTTYILGAFYLNNSPDHYIEGANSSTYDTTNISAVGPGKYVQASSLQFPDASASSIGYIGPNAEFTVPEPSTWALLLGGVGMLAVLRRRRIA